MRAVQALVLAMLALLSACSMRSALNSMTPEQDRAFAHEMVAHLRSGDEAWLRQRFRPDLWEESAKQLAGVPALFPAETGTTELVGFESRFNSAGGRTEREKNFNLVTHGGGRWTVTSFRTYSDGGPEKVVQWSVVPHASEPTELAVLNGMDAALPWIWGGAIAVLLLALGLIVWLVRRSGRKRRAA